MKRKRNVSTPGGPERKRFLARGRSRRALELYAAAWEESRRQLDRWRDEVGAFELVWGSPTWYPSMPALWELPGGGPFGVIGARFREGVPRGWTRRAGGFCSPNPRTDAGRKLLVEMFSLVTPNFPRPIVGGDVCVAKRRGKGFEYLSADVERLAGEFVISMHPDAPPPLDGEPLADSEYRRLKQRAGEAG